MTRSLASGWFVCAAVVLLSSCAVVPGDGSRGDHGSLTIDTIEIEGYSYVTHWYRPTGKPIALIVMQPGFTRQCVNLRETTRELVRTGAMALCIDASMAGGNPMLADALAGILVGGLVTPDGGTLPDRIIVAGHSAGGAFAVRLGGHLSRLAPARLAGALLFDPVAAAGFTVDLNAISANGRRPVRAVMAQAYGCNANQNAVQALQRVRVNALDAGRDGFVGVQLGAGSTHVDVEGEDSDWVGMLACGRPTPANVALLRRFAVQFLAQIASGAETDAPLGTDARAIE